MNHKRKIQEYVDFTREKKIRQTPKPKFPGFKAVRDPQWQKVVDWINKNFMLPREKRQDQLWLWSAQPKLGKSWPFAIQLRDYFNIYEWTSEEKQDDTIKDAQYLLFDDFHGTCTVSMLKRLSQMYGTPVPIKLGKRCDFQQNVPLIITSNDDPEGVFHNTEPNHLNALKDRFTIIEVTTKCKLQLKPPIEEVQILVPATPPPSPPQDVMDDLGDKADISEMSDSDDDRNEDEHSEFSNEEYSKTKKAWFKKHKKNLI